LTVKLCSRNLSVVKRRYKDAQISIIEAVEASNEELLVVAVAPVNVAVSRFARFTKEKPSAKSPRIHSAFWPPSTYIGGERLGCNVIIFSKWAWLHNILLYISLGRVKDIFAKHIAHTTASPTEPRPLGSLREMLARRILQLFELFYKLQ
jgi:hypothetical protein